MPKADIEDPFHELQEECYICFEPCQTKSPCKCERFVHKKCLKDWRDKSNNDACTECLEKYPPDRNPNRLHSCMLAVVLYIIFGIFGQLCYELFQKQSIRLTVPWSIEYFISSLMVGGLFVFIYGLIKRYRVVASR